MDEDSIIMAALIMVFYVIPTVIAFRAPTAMSVTGRAIFAVVTPPAFLLLTMINIHLVATFLPYLLEDMDSYRKESHAVAFLAFPLPILFTYVLYYVLVFLFPNRKAGAE